MANTLSDLMTNILAKPSVNNPVSSGRGQVYMAVARAVIAASESAAHVFPLFRVRATDRIFALWATHGDLGTTLTIDVGLYQAGDWTAADQTVIDVDCYADGYNAAAAATTNPVQLYGAVASVVGGVGTYAQQVWQDGAATITAQPVAGTQYDVCATIATTGTPAAGTLSVLMLYSGNY